MMEKEEGLPGTLTKPEHIWPIGVVLERRQITNPWQDHSWRAVAVIPGAQRIGERRVLRQGEGWAQYHAGTLDLELHRKETEGYRLNLSSPRPMVFVVLRPDEDAVENNLLPFRVTVCPYESQDYEDSGHEVVEGVPMPDEVQAWVWDFVDKYHVDVPFKKRKRKPYAPRKEDLGRRGNGGSDGRR